MPNRTLLKALSLELPGVPACFSCDDLESSARVCLGDLDALVHTDQLLSGSVLSHQFTFVKEEDLLSTTRVMLVVGLTLKESTQLDMFRSSLDPAAAAAILKADFERFVSACRGAHATCNEVSLQFARRVRKACLDIPAGELDKQVRDHLVRSRRAAGKTLRGTVGNSRFNYETSFPCVYDFSAETVDVYVRIKREKIGFTLALLTSCERPPALNGIGSLRMPEFPREAAETARLDAAAHSGQPAWLKIRLGQDLADARPSVADFIAFADPSPQQPT